MRKNGNVVLIAPREELALKEKQQLESQMQISELEPLRLRVVPAQLHQGGGPPQPHHDQPAAAVRRGRRADGDDRRPGLDPVQARRRDRRPAHQHPVRAGHRRAARGGAQDHPPDRHADPPGADRGAHRRSPSDKFSQQLGVRFGLQTGFTLNNKYAVRLRAARLSTQPVVKTDGDRLVRETRTQTPFELASGLATAGYSDSPQLNVNLPVPNAGRPARADADQPRQRQPHQPRAVGARGRRPRQGRLEPARGHRRQPEGAHRAGHGNPVRDAGHARTRRRPCSSRRRCCAST